MNEALCKCFKPSGEVGGQGRRTRDQGNAIDAEPRLLQTRCVVARSREIPSGDGERFAVSSGCTTRNDFWAISVRK
jgi:hypothetical protein